MRRFSLYLVLLALLFLFCACKKQAAVETMTQEDALTYAGFRDTLLYYASNDGMLVPLMRQIPWEEGIGKAALGYLIDTEENRAVLQKYGLSAPLPDGTSIQLRIKEDKKAIVTLSSCTPPDDAAQEQIRVASIVNTLTAFPTIDSVSITANGEPMTPSEESGEAVFQSAFAPNAEDSAVAASTGTAYPMTLYFPNRAASLLIPVTRYQDTQPTFSSAVQGLIDGPQSALLASCFPEGTTLLEASIENDMASVNLSAEFSQAAETEGLLEAARETLYLTACAFTDVSALDILVEGKLLEADANAVLPLYPNVLE